MKARNLKTRSVLLLLILSVLLNIYLFNSFNLKDNSNNHELIKKFDENHLNTQSTSPLLDFKYYKKITIDHDQVTGSLQNFPLLLSIIDEDLRWDVQEDGDDIAFYNGSDWLDHEIEVFNQTYSSTHAQLVAWVRVPLLSATNDTVLYMCYGNNTLGPQENPSGVWDSNYKGVWHLSEDPEDTAPQIKDSSQYTNDGTTYNLTSADQVNGKIDGSLNFTEGSEDYIVCGSDSSLNMGSGDFTFSLWFNYSEGSPTKPLAGKGAYMPGGKRYYIALESGKIKGEIDDDSTKQFLESVSTVDDSLWHYAVLIRSGNYLRFYVDGTEVPGSPIDITGYGSLDMAMPFTINTLSSDPSVVKFTEWSTSKMDEVHVVQTARSADWVETEYNNQYNPNSFYTIGNSNELDMPIVQDYNYYKVITIDHNNVEGTGTHSNFPVLVSIFDRDLHDKVQPNGDDIAFSDGFELYDHEIELFNQTFNNTHAQLVAWVRIPSLSPSSNTDIYMHYGNPDLNPPRNSTNVWNSNYNGVWHLSEDRVGFNNLDIYKDSSANVFDGDDHISATEQEGQIDGGQMFDGLDDYVEINDIGAFTNLTVSAWIKPTEWPDLSSSYIHNIFGDEEIEVSTPPNTLCLRIGSEGNNDYKQRVGLGLNISNTWGDYESASNLSLNSWHYLTVSYNGTDVVFYINGSLDNIQSNSGTIGNAKNNWNIGRAQSSGNERYYEGFIDDVRILNTSLNSGWIKTEYNNQHAPNSFYSVGPEQYTGNCAPNTEYFSHYKAIRINHTKVNGSNSHMNFPLLISTFDLDLRDKVQSNGADIAFAFNNSWLDHEIELFNKTYNNTHAQIIAWVRLPSLSPVMDTTIYMYFGNSTMGSRENPQGVWDSGYKGIWHLKEKTNDPSPQFNDSTTNNNDGSSFGFSSEGQTQGKIDGSIAFVEGGENQIQVSDGTSLRLSDDLTISAWINSSDIDSEPAIIISKWSSIGNRNYWLGKRNETALSFFTDGNQQNVSANLNLIDDNKWHYIVGVADSSNNLLKIYIDGVLQATSSYDGTSQVGNAIFCIGANFHAVSQEWNGTIDETRVSDIVRSNDWIATEFYNQHDPNSFYSLGNASRVYIPTKDDFKYNKPIKINHSKVSGSEVLTNFPVLISIYDSDLRVFAQPNGNDIAFFIGDQILAHEIEEFNQSYNDTHAQFVAWIRVPYLSPSIDTEIYMCYGNSTMKSQENAHGVWDNNYIGVWHLNDVLTGLGYDSYDSTVLSNDGYSQGSMDSSNLVESQIGGGLDFDGVNDNITTYENNHLAGLTSLTMSAWIKPRSTQQDFCGIVEYDNATDTDSFEAGIELRSNLAPRVNVWTDVNWNYTESTNTLLTSQFTYFVFVYDGNLTIYLDGALDTTKAHSGTIRNKFRNINIGSNAHDSRTFNGIIDEVRISKINRSADWIATEYNNQHDPNSFYSFSPDITPPSFSNLLESADPLDLGDTETILIDVNDMSEINQVKIEIEGNNYTMSPAGGNTWRYDPWTPSSTGTFVYVIHAEDLYGNWNSTGGSIEVIDVPAPPPPSPGPSPITDLTAPSYSNLLESANPLELGNIAIISINVSDPSGVNQVIIEFENQNRSMTYIGGEMWQYSWNASIVGDYNYIIYMEDNSNNWESIGGTLKVVDTIPPVPLTLLSSPQGEVNGTLIFDWEDGSDPSSIAYYRLIIDTETDPFFTPGYNFEINITNTGPESSYYKLEDPLPPGNYYFFIYQIDGAGHQSESVRGNFTIIDPNLPLFYLLIIIIIAAVLILSIGIIAKKKVSKRKQRLLELPEEKEAIELLEYTEPEIIHITAEKIREMGPKSLKNRREKLLEAIEVLDVTKNYIKMADYLEELIVIDELLGLNEELEIIKEKHMEVIVKAGDYTKALELYKETDEEPEQIIEKEKIGAIEKPKKTIDVDFEEDYSIDETFITQMCINEIITKFGEENGFNYYSHIQVYSNSDKKVDGVILNDAMYLTERLENPENGDYLVEELAFDPNMLTSINALYFVYTEDLSESNLVEICESYQNSNNILMIIGIEWPKFEYALKMDVPQHKNIKYPKNIKIVHYDLFSEFLGLSEDFKAKLQAVVDFSKNLDLDSLKKFHESNKIKLLNRKNLKQELKEKELIKEEIEEYFDFFKN